jgi:uncharacterized membrane protein
MKSGSSCLTSVILILAALIMIRFGLPSVWRVLVGLFAGAFYLGAFLSILLIVLFGFLIYRNLQKNKAQERSQQFAPGSETLALYRSVVERLQKDMILNQVTAEEFLQSEILMGETLSSLQQELSRFKEFASSASVKSVERQIQEYGRQIRETDDSSVKQLIGENLKLMEEKKERLITATQQIKEKEALVDWIHNRLLIVDEDLRFGRTVRQLFPPELYERFGIASPESERASLPPFGEKSSIDRTE